MTLDTSRPLTRGKVRIIIIGMDKKQRSINEQKRLGVYDRNEYIRYLHFVKGKGLSEIGRMKGIELTKQRIDQIIHRDKDETIVLSSGNLG